MSDDIRTDIGDILRSKEVVLDGTYHLNTESAWLLADELIRIFLRREWGALDENQDGVLSDNYHDVTGFGGVIHTRYITDWRPTNSSSAAVHNHGTEEGEGLACREVLVDGELKGACLRSDAVIADNE